MGAYILNDLPRYEKFLILGHKGFLGQNISNSLLNLGNSVTTVSNRINLKNLEEITSNYFTSDTVVINCIASGVTPYSSNDDTDDLINVKLLEGLLEFFIKSRSSRFIQFGTLYEIDEDVKTIIDRLSYVNSKALGSQITKSYGENDARIKLIYLPTILGHNQPEGRFFIDFIKSAGKSAPFKLLHPNSTIKLAAYNSFFRYLFKVINSEENSVFYLPVEAKMSVVEFSGLLNTILIKNNYGSVNIVTDELHQMNYNELDVPEDFVKIIEQMVISIMGKSR